MRTDEGRRTKIEPGSLTAFPFKDGKLLLS